METYKTLDEFILKVFPLEHEKMLKQRTSKITEALDEVDVEFAKKLAEIMNGDAD